MRVQRYELFFFLPNFSNKIYKKFLDVDFFGFAEGSFSRYRLVKAAQPSAFARENKEKLVFLWFSARLFVPLDNAEGTFARDNKEKRVFLWFSARLFVPLHRFEWNQRRKLTLWKHCCGLPLALLKGWTRGKSGQHRALHF